MQKVYLYVKGVCVHICVYIYACIKAVDSGLVAKK